MNCSPHGLRFIREFEACRLIAYRDQKGVWTIGWGHTGPEVQNGVRWAQSEADAAFTRDVAWAERAVNSLVTTALTQNQFDALTSFCFNVGAQNFKLSTLLRKVNGSDMVGAQAQFPRWSKITDPKTGLMKVSAGLARRRAAEKSLFNLKDPTP